MRINGLAVSVGEWNCSMSYLSDVAVFALVVMFTIMVPAIAEPLTAGDIAGPDVQEDANGPTDEVVLSGELEEGWLDRLQALPKLRKLTIRRPTNLSEKSVAGLAKLRGLEAFCCEGMPIDSPLADATLKAVAGIPSLRLLSLKATGITDEGLRALTASSLTDLSLHGEERLTSKALEHVAAIPNLLKLTLHTTPIDAEGLKHLQACRQLKELLLLRVICRKDRVEAVAGIKSLERLALSRAAYPDLVVLQRLSLLRSLRLQYSGAFKAAESLGKLPQLETVQMEDCDLREETPEELKAKLAEVGIEVVELEGQKAARGDPDSSVSVNEATTLARRAHATLASASDFPSFWVKWRTQAGAIPSMSAERIRTVRLLKHALKAEADMTTFGRQEITFAWSPGQFLVGNQTYMPKEPDNISRAFKFGTKDWACAYEQRNEKPPKYFLRTGVAEFADSFWPVHGALSVTPKEFWWGDNSHRNLSTSRVPLHLASYFDLPGEELAGEPCRVVESAARAERLWISEKTGRLRGHLDYMHQGFYLPFYRTEQVTEIVGHSVSSREEYRALFGDGDGALPKQKQIQLGAAWSEYCHGKTSHPGSLRVFDDYREIAEGRWFPFHVRRAGWLHHRDDDELYRFHASESRVDDVRTDRTDLSVVWKPFLPTEGGRVQDQRFDAVVEYDYRQDRPEAEILELVNAQLLKLAESKQRLADLTAPIQEMVGKPAPLLPESDWTGERPDLAGKSYLLHFWAVWCGPCKNDVSLLNAIAKRRTVIGVHPSGTPMEDVREAVETESMEYPSVVAQENSNGILGYPVKMFPYCIEVDEKGTVVKHGALREILD